MQNETITKNTTKTLADRLELIFTEIQFESMERQIFLKKTILLGIVLLCNLSLSLRGNPSAVSRTSHLNTLGEPIVQTIISIDKTTTRDELIHTCQFLAGESIELAFQSLDIRKPFLGLIGKARIVRAKGTIRFPDNQVTKFEAGDTLGFESIQIIFSENVIRKEYFLNTIEVID